MTTRTTTLGSIFGLILMLLLAGCAPGGATIPAAATRTPGGSSDGGAGEPGLLPTAGATAMLPDAPTGVDRLAQLAEVFQAVDWRLADNGDWVGAQLGQPLDQGNQLRTGLNSRATVLFTEGAILRLSENSLFTVTEMNDDPDGPITRLQLLFGQVFVILTQPLNGGEFDVETPTGVASVRGSFMSVRVTASSRTVVACLEGQCQLGNAAGVLPLTNGQQTQIVAAEQPASPPAPMHDYQYNEWFDYNPEAVSVALQVGVVTEDRLPDTCDMATGAGCEIALACDPRDGDGCAPLPTCDINTGAGCELPSGCNPVTGLGCDTPDTCDAATGAGCELPTGCNPITGAGCFSAAVFNGNAVVDEPRPLPPTPEGGVQATPVVVTRIAPTMTAPVIRASDTPDLTNLRPTATIPPILTQLPVLTVPVVTLPPVILPTATRPPADLRPTDTPASTDLQPSATPRGGGNASPTPTPTSGDLIIIIPTLPPPTVIIQP